MTNGWCVDSSGRFLRRNGEPWFLLGDTAWELFRRLTKAEVDAYLRKRAEQGFNTVLAVTFGCDASDGLREPTILGQLPFHDLDATQPNEQYWQHVDWTIRLANSVGLIVGLAPCWGNHWHGSRSGSGPFFNPTTALTYASWLADRYKGDDILWVLGGDYPVTTMAHLATVDAFARGIRRIVGRRQLMTFHPYGRCTSSSDYLPDVEWLDFNMIQSGHRGWHTPNYQMIEHDYEQQPIRPTLDGEPNYEASPVMDPQWRPVPGHHFDEHDVRRAAHHAVFAGACGHVYGCHDVWQMHDPDRWKPINGARYHWRTALDLPGARQMAHLAALMADVGLGEWKPAQRLIRSGRRILGAHQRALTDRDGRRALIYAPEGRDVHLDVSHWTGRYWRARWWNPRSGSWSETTCHRGDDRLSIRHPFPGLDGVLLLDAAA